MRPAKGTDHGITTAPMAVRPSSCTAPAPAPCPGCRPGWCSVAGPPRPCPPNTQHGAPHAADPPELHTAGPSGPATGRREQAAANSDWRTPAAAGRAHSASIAGRRRRGLRGSRVHLPWRGCARGGRARSGCDAIAGGHAKGPPTRKCERVKRDSRVHPGVHSRSAVWASVAARLCSTLGAFGLPLDGPRGDAGEQGWSDPGPLGEAGTLRLGPASQADPPGTSSQPRCRRRHEVGGPGLDAAHAPPLVAAVRASTSSSLGPGRWAQPLGA
jgi:hypothetical protein